MASSRVVNHYRPDLIVDGNAGSCIYLDTRVDDRFIQIDLGRNHLITGLLLHVPDGTTSFEQHCLNVIIISDSLVNRLHPGTDRFHSREIGIRPGHPVSQVNCCTHCQQTESFVAAFYIIVWKLFLFRFCFSGARRACRASMRLRCTSSAEEKTAVRPQFRAVSSTSATKGKYTISTLPFAKSKSTACQVLQKHFFLSFSSVSVAYRCLSCACSVAAH